MKSIAGFDKCQLAEIGLNGVGRFCQVDRLAGSKTLAP
jgi:hypothetical protein